MVEIGRVISNRYLLQHLIKQGEICAVYQGVDQVLQRAVAVKIVPAEHIPSYRAAIRVSSQFSHPNIIDFYDLVDEPNVLYMVQEYVEGEDFATLQQAQLSPYEVVKFGSQICQALVYAGSSSRNVCHGDLTPTSLIRDCRGTMRINNFALPSNTAYFTLWNSIEGDSWFPPDDDVSLGQQTEARQACDVRAVGFLLYQLLVGCVEPPPDGQLRFQRNTPAMLCETVARTMLCHHPQYISTVETLYAELKTLLEGLAPPQSDSYPAVMKNVDPNTEPAKFAKADPTTDPTRFRQLSSAGKGRLATAPPVRERVGRNGQQAAAAHLQELDAASPTIANVAFNPANVAPAYPTYYPENEMNAPAKPKRFSTLLLLLICLLVFALFFFIGNFLGQSLPLPH